MTDTTEAQKPKPPKTETITVNDDPVEVTEKQMTGAEIKAAAIAAGVPIEQDFVLSEVLPNGKQKPIADDKKVEIKDGLAFWAIPGDDNS
jgi:hypothetical protein